jgi:CheY-like chemotaxis protein
MPTALIVEDEPHANEMLRLLIQTRGFQTGAVFSGGEALESVRTTLPDVLFLDLMLPDLDGFEICRALGRDRRTTLIPVVIVTARMTKDCEMEAYQVGAARFIRKPYTPETIFDALVYALRWKEEATSCPKAGMFTLDALDPMASLREIGLLHRLLVAWTQLDEPEIFAIGDALRGLRSSALASIERARANQVIGVQYAIEPDGIELSVEDPGEWLEQFTREPAYESLAINGPFDSVSTRPSEGLLTMIKRRGTGDWVPA